VITDLAMPQVTGIDLVKYIKSDESKANMGIIVVSSLVDERSRLECLRLGVDEFLTKPVMPFDFLLRVKKLIANNAPQEEE
jgi:DNA-binding response OmpR family regulator